MNVYYGESGELMATIPLQMYEELLEIKGRYSELKRMVDNSELKLSPKIMPKTNVREVCKAYDNNGNRPKFK